MGFINGYTSQDDIKKFKLDELFNKYQNSSTSYKHHWIVNKEINSWLILVKQINNSETIWILHHKNTNIEIRLYKRKHGWSLTSIASNPLDNLEIIESMQEALKILNSSNTRWMTPKKTDLREKRKINYVDILLFIVILVIVFFIANDNNRNRTSIIKNDNNETSEKTQTTKHAYDLYSVMQTSNHTQAIYGINHDKLGTWNKILSFNGNLISSCKADKYGNIYWRNTATQSIYKANPDGTNIRKIAVANNGLGGIAIDNKNEKIFWIERLTGKNYSEIVYTNFFGKNKKIIISNEDISNTTRGILYDYLHDRLYFTDWTDKGVISIDLKTKEIKNTAYSSSSEDIVLDYKNKRIIWINTKSDNIYSSNFDGSDKKVLIAFDNASSNPGGLAINTINERLIYGYYNSVKDKFILETSNLDGSNKKIEKASFFNPMKSLFFTHNVSY